MRSIHRSSWLQSEGSAQPFMGSVCSSPFRMSDPPATAPLCQIMSQRVKRTRGKSQSTPWLIAANEYEVESPYPRSDCHLRCQGNVSPSYQALHGIAILHTIQRSPSLQIAGRGFDVVMGLPFTWPVHQTRYTIYSLGSIYLLARYSLQDNR